MRRIPSFVILLVGAAVVIALGFAAMGVFGER
jgi:hypothetical protein